MMYKIVFILFFTLSTLATLKSNDRFSYIDRFANIAIAEMQRTGIPASIKLAQGILESNAGQSTLAIKANNHFGIKCGSQWGGKKYFRKDDDRDKRGRIIKSCFREFSSAEESYLAHSEFLMDPKKFYRYGPLFDLQSDDYKGWAKGLKKAGYATNPKYAHLIIKVIEDYQLYKYDQAIPPAHQIVKTEVENKSSNEKVVDVKIEKPNGETVLIKDKVEVPTIKEYNQTIQYFNGAKFVLSADGDTPEKLARKFKLSVHQIMRYNSELKLRKQNIESRKRVYLSSKKNKFKGQQKYHIVQQKELLTDVSREYGVSIDAIRKRNDIPLGKEPAVGEKIYLKGKNRNPVKYRTVYLEEMSKKGEVKKSEVFLEPTTSNAMKQVFHTVASKDTLYGISKAYGVTVDSLKKLNKLAENTIHPGQILQIK